MLNLNTENNLLPHHVLFACCKRRLTRIFKEIDFYQQNYNKTEDYNFEDGVKPLINSFTVDML